MRNATGWAGLSLAGLAASVSGQWDPGTGAWGRTDPDDYRVMAWNVEDAICSTNTKSGDAGLPGYNNWNACVRIVAAMRPDVLILTETGDNSGNGTGAGVDSVATLTTVLNLFLHGGTDTFNGGVPVTSYVQLYAPGYDLPYIHVSSNHDNFNRNVILSRYLFADLNGDTRAVYNDIPLVAAHLWAPGGNGGIRGFPFVEINLPDGTYAGNAVVGGAHLKSGGSGDDATQRLNAAKNVSYVVQHWYNANQGSTPDPFNKIIDVPAATLPLDAHTPVFMGGDFNEDENSTPSTRGPVSYLAAGGVIGGADGTDHDGTDARYDDSRDPFTNGRATQSSSKLDYIVWQESIATLRRSFIYNSSSGGSAAWPPEIETFFNPALISGRASDHKPVIADFMLPLAPDDPPPGAFALLSPGDGADGLAPVGVSLSWEASAGADTYTVEVDDAPAFDSPLVNAGGVAGQTYALPELVYCTEYFWRVTAVNESGSTLASGSPRGFTVRAEADVSGSSDVNNPMYGVPDGLVDSSDFFYFLDQFVAGNLAAADLSGSADPNDPSYGVPDGAIDSADFFYFLDVFVQGC
ncbi:MAG: endonuclease/exonuclease/phosphatase family protein [Phycisphaerales bacterium]|nr:endonuclease/exonuclease/phosphatase family protein [Phycisphaerales bacterium]